MEMPGQVTTAWPAAFMKMTSSIRPDHVIPPPWGFAGCFWASNEDAGEDDGAEPQRRPARGSPKTRHARCALAPELGHLRPLLPQEQQDEARQPAPTTPKVSETACTMRGASASVLSGDECQDVAHIGRHHAGREFEHSQNRKEGHRRRNSLAEGKPARREGIEADQPAGDEAGDLDGEKRQHAARHQRHEKRPTLHEQKRGDQQGTSPA